jgi:hypothetical protein
VTFAACSGTSSPSTGTGDVSLSVSDTAAQHATHVCVEFTELEFKRAGAENRVFIFDPPKKINLLQYQGVDAAPLLVDEELEAGEYQWVRIGVNAERAAGNGAGAGPMDALDDCSGTGSYLVSDTGLHGLYIPSGAESGLKLNRGFTLPVNGSADFVAEWDLMKTIHAPPGLEPDYIMRPTVRLMDQTRTGSIAGEVSLLLATQAGCVPSVYVFEPGVAPDDIEDDADDPAEDPIAAAMVAMREEDGKFRYEVGPLLEGEYDVAFTCDEDDNSVDQDLTFVLFAENPVSVAAGQQASADFD